MTACSTSLPSREIIAYIVEYMVNASDCADACLCISNCDRHDPVILMAARRIKHPELVFIVSGGARW